MSWNCYSVELIVCDPPIEDVNRPGIFHTRMFRVNGQDYNWRQLKVGAMYDDPYYGICVKVPGYSGNNRWQMKRPDTNGFLWSVSGQIPNVTATPSINFVGTYHGWVTNGVVTDDCEGRKFDDLGNLL